MVQKPTALMHANQMPGELALNQYLDAQRESFFALLSGSEKAVCTKIPAVSVPTYTPNAWITAANLRDDLYIEIDSQFFLGADVGSGYTRITADPKNDYHFLHTSTSPC